MACIPYYSVLKPWRVDSFWAGFGNRDCRSITLCVVSKETLKKRGELEKEKMRLDVV